MKNNLPWLNLVLLFVFVVSLMIILPGCRKNEDNISKPETVSAEQPTVVQETETIETTIEKKYASPEIVDEDIEKDSYQNEKMPTDAVEETVSTLPTETTTLIVSGQGTGSDGNISSEIFD